MKKAVILAAGEGKRLKPFTESIPKVMMPVANKPIMEYVINAVKKNGIHEIILVVGYKKESIMDYFKDGKKFDVSIEYAVQEKQLGTAHALFQAKPFIDEEFLVLPGDNIIDAESISLLCKDDSEMALLVEYSSNPSKYGVVKIEDGLVKGILEKPEKAEESIISTGIYKLQPNIFKSIEECLYNGKNDLTTAIDVFIKKGEEIKAIKGKGKWMDILYPWDLLSINGRVMQNISPSTAGKIEKNVIIKGNVFVGKDSIIHSGCFISGPVIIGEGCEIGPNVCIFPSTSIGNNVTIHPFSEIRNSVIMDEVFIDSHSKISHSVMGKGCRISSHFLTLVGKSMMYIENEIHEMDDLGCFIGDGCIIGGNVIVGEGKIIGKNCIIDSLKIINKDIPTESKVM
ncbi:MAG: nucleotidyl transferase [Thermoplasmata archaeon]|nr:MAG: nucleotidyl transferase [Thermoplasmata archaeon]